MKPLSRIVSASLLLAIVLLPLSVAGDQIPTPMVKKIPAGTASVQYFGQTLRFTTAERLRLEFSATSTTEFRLTVRPLQNSGPSAGYNVLEIYWTNFGTTPYDGPAPSSSEPWTGVLNTESGFTEK